MPMMPNDPAQAMPAPMPRGGKKTKLAPMVGQGTQGQMLGNTQLKAKIAPDAADQQTAMAQAQKQKQSSEMGTPAIMAGAPMPAGMPNRDRVTTQIQDGLKNQLGGKPMGGETHTMPDGTMMPNKAMPMPAPMPKPGYGGTTTPSMPMPRPMPVTPRPMGKPMTRPMPGPMKPNKPMKPKPMPPSTVGPIGL